MKTLVIHPKDETTRFLSTIYADKDWTVIDAVHPQKKMIKQAMKDHDRIVMLGHGTESGLVNVDFNPIIDSNLVYLLRDKICVSIWCHLFLFYIRFSP